MVMTASYSVEMNFLQDLRSLHLLLTEDKSSKLMLQYSIHSGVYWFFNHCDSMLLVECCITPDGCSL